MRKILMLIGAIGLSACSILSPQKANHISSKAIGDKGDLYSIPANLRTIDVRKKDADYIVCSEPVPDIAMSNALKLALEASNSQSASASTKTGEDSTSGSVSNALGLKGASDASTTALELAGRTQIVLLAREFISSNCKARANGWITDEEFKNSQDAVIKQISEMINTENEKAKAEKAKAEAVGAAVKAELDKKALANVATAFQQAKTDSCLNNYDTCISAAAGDSNKVKACKSTLIKCNN
ncbi:hypothetical protein [Cellvibrio japonicus]|uniref:hypothetical protein n=1 Tax=Cellvibrio japonicus TaxID=155077 RepID=UPI0005A155A3|nr:hypothetical protein [Cellvibrio japonicus]QEI11218.1 hypothetical protein FY117_02530 [Cellvibrio japonicus]QEI14792.1 hypothetical protein FY116_02530 [Cellvibrio japonicus]QEI18372.1 hypothetical protein FY115_02530 [Cellvibrio japonicus]